MSRFAFILCPENGRNIVSRVLFLQAQVPATAAWSLKKPQKWLGEGAKGVLNPGSKGLPRVFCTT